jgi:hypothetical protein
MHRAKFGSQAHSSQHHPMQPGKRRTDAIVADYRFDKLFTPEEANELIPRLSALIRDLQASANRLRAAADEMTDANPSLANFHLGALLDCSPELKAIANEMAGVAAQIESFGCYLKDIDRGLLDFPFELRGEVAFLCWQYGEPQVLAWHNIEEGFAGRRPLPGAPKTYLH